MMSFPDVDLLKQSLREQLFKKIEKMNNKDRELTKYQGTTNTHLSTSNDTSDTSDTSNTWHDRYVWRDKTNYPYPNFPNYPIRFPDSRTTTAERLPIDGDDIMITIDNSRVSLSKVLEQLIDQSRTIIDRDDTVDPQLDLMYSDYLGKVAELKDIVDMYRTFEALLKAK